MDTKKKKAFTFYIFPYGRIFLAKPCVIQKKKKKVCLKLRRCRILEGLLQGDRLKLDMIKMDLIQTHLCHFIQHKHKHSGSRVKAGLE